MKSLGTLMVQIQGCYRTFLANINYYFIVLSLDPRIASTQTSSLNSVKIFLWNPGELVQVFWLLWKCFSFLPLKITVIKAKDVLGAATFFRINFFKVLKQKTIKEKLLKNSDFNTRVGGVENWIRNSQLESYLKGLL